MRFDYSVTIRRPPPAVFAMLADVQDWGKEERAALVPVMEKITPGPTRVGTRWHEVIQLAPAPHDDGLVRGRRHRAGPPAG